MGARQLRAVLRRVMPGAPVGGPGPPARERLVAGAIPVFEQGAGPAILIAHAGSADATSWAAVAARLADRFQVVRYTRPIYRLPPPPAGAAAMAREVADVLAVADSLDGPVLLVGHSSGGVVALESALARHFAGLVLYEPPVAVSAPLGGAALVQARAALDAGDPGRAMTLHLRALGGVSAATVFALRLVSPLWRFLRGHAGAQIADDEALESLGVGIERYAAIDVPVLLLGGERSPAHLRQRLDALRAVLSTVESTVILRHQGHLANLRAPDAVARVVAAFAARVLG